MYALRASLVATGVLTVLLLAGRGGWGLFLRLFSPSPHVLLSKGMSPDYDKRYKERE